MPDGPSSRIMIPRAIIAHLPLILSASAVKGPKFLMSFSFFGLLNTSSQGTCGERTHAMVTTVDHCVSTSLLRGGTSEVLDHTEGTKGSKPRLHGPDERQVSADPCALSYLSQARREGRQCDQSNDTQSRAQATTDNLGVHTLTAA